LSIQASVKIAYFYTMRDELINRLTHQPASLDISIKGLTEEQVKSRPIPEKWSIFENLAHLARYHEIFKDRTLLIAQGHTPVFQPYRADDDPGFFSWQQKSYAQLMTDFYADRAALNAQLATFTPEQLQGAGKHSVYGLFSLEGWTEFFLLHEAHHYFTIMKLAAMIDKDRVIGL